MKILWQLDALRYEIRVTGILLFSIPLFFAFGMAAHHGSLTISSQPGQGTTVLLSLPAIHTRA